MAVQHVMCSRLHLVLMRRRRRIVAVDTAVVVETMDVLSIVAEAGHCRSDTPVVQL